MKPRQFKLLAGITWDYSPSYPHSSPSDDGGYSEVPFTLPVEADETPEEVAADFLDNHLKECAREFPRRSYSWRVVSLEEVK